MKRLLMSLLILVFPYLTFAIALIITIIGTWTVDIALSPLGCSLDGDPIPVWSCSNQQIGEQVAHILNSIEIVFFAVGLTAVLAVFNPVTFVIFLVLSVLLYFFAKESPATKKKQKP